MSSKRRSVGSFDWSEDPSAPQLPTRAAACDRWDLSPEQRTLLDEQLQRPVGSVLHDLGVLVDSKPDLLASLLALVLHHGAVETRVRMSDGSLSPDAASSPSPPPSGRVSPVREKKLVASNSGTLWRKPGVATTTGLHRNVSLPVLGRRPSRSASVSSPVAVRPASPAPVVSSSSAHSSSVEGDKLSLTELIELPDSAPQVQSFQRFLKSVLASENFAFIRDLHAYSRTVFPSPAHREDAARQLYAMYFHPDSPLAINVDSRASAAVVQRYGPLSLDLFAAARKAVMQNLSCDLLPRFLALSESSGASLSGSSGAIPPPLPPRDPSRRASVGPQAVKSPPRLRSHKSSALRPASSDVSGTSMSVSSEEVVLVMSTQPESWDSSALSPDRSERSSDM